VGKREKKSGGQSKRKKSKKKQKRKKNASRLEKGSETKSLGLIPTTKTKQNKFLPKEIVGD
jgi:hypothetical protein